MRELSEDGKYFKTESERKSILETDRFSIYHSLTFLIMLTFRFSEQLIVEGPWMMKRDGKYFLFYSSGWVSMSSYHVGVAVANSIDEEFVKSETPVIRSREIEGEQCSWLCGVLGLGYDQEVRNETVRFDGPGHGSVVEDDAGDWWFVYAAWEGGHVNIWPPARLMMLDKIEW